MSQDGMTPEAAVAEAWCVAARIPGLLSKLAALRTQEQDALLWPRDVERLELDAAIEATSDELRDCKGRIEVLAEEARLGLAFG